MVVYNVGTSKYYKHNGKEKHISTSWLVTRFRTQNKHIVLGLPKYASLRKRKKHGQASGWKRSNENIFHVSRRQNQLLMLGTKISVIAIWGGGLSPYSVLFKSTLNNNAKMKRNWLLNCWEWIKVPSCPPSLSLQPW